MPHAKGYTWDQMYLDEYAKGKSFVFGEKPDRFIVWASEYLKEKHLNGAVILDAGFGEGRNSVYLAKQGFKMYGVDIASPAIEKARRRIRSEGLTEIVNLIVGDVTRLPMKMISSMRSLIVIRWNSYSKDNDTFRELPEY